MDRAQELFAEFLEELGLTGDAEMELTPKRFTQLLRSYSGAESAGSPPPVSTFAVQSSGPVMLRDLPFYSLCAHHLLPFFGHATIAYLPGASVAGLSGIGRVLNHVSRRPHLQERLAEQVADVLFGALEPRALAVELTARQMCMEMRGERHTGELIVTAYRGVDAEKLLTKADV